MAVCLKLMGFALTLAILLYPASLHGEVYMWTDDQGVRHFSNISPPSGKKSTRTRELTLTIPKGYSCRVIKVYDGDTIRVQGKDLAFKVRLAGIDCPESGWKEMPEQPFAKQAEKALARMIYLKSVVLKQHGIGGYNRVLAEVFLRGRNINLAMVAKGLAEVYRGRLPASLDTHAYKAAEDAARRKKTGIWSRGNDYVSPRLWRKRFQGK